MCLMLMDNDYKTMSVEEKKTNIHGRYIRQTSKRVSKSTWVEKECIKRGSIIQFTHIPKKTFEVMCFSRKKYNKFPQSTLCLNIKKAMYEETIHQTKLQEKKKEQSKNVQSSKKNVRQKM